jgi:cobalt/nickel transport protein
MKQTSIGWQNWLLLAGVVVLSIAPLVLIKDAEFAGADDQAGQAIEELQPEYEPWFQPLLEPASGEVASLLFAAQAALGAGVIGYVMGLSKGRNSRQGSIESPSAPTNSSAGDKN